MLFPAAFRAHFRRSIQKNLELCTRKHHRPDVASLHYNPAAGAGALLLSDQHMAHFCDRCEPRRRLRSFLSANFLGAVHAVPKNTMLHTPRFWLRPWGPNFVMRVLGK